MLMLFAHCVSFQYYHVIVQTFLKNENINYKIYPVASYTELEGKIEDAKIY
jgi:hypothetical protein